MHWQWYVNKKIYQKMKYRLPLQRRQKKRFTFLCKNPAVFASENPQILLCKSAKTFRSFFASVFARAYISFFALSVTFSTCIIFSTPSPEMEIYTIYVHCKLLKRRWVWKFYARERIINSTQWIWREGGRHKSKRLFLGMPRERHYHSFYAPKNV